MDKLSVAVNSFRIRFFGVLAVEDIERQHFCLSYSFLSVCPKNPPKIFFKIVRSFFGKIFDILADFPSERPYVREGHNQPAHIKIALTIFFTGNFFL